MSGISGYGNSVGVPTVGGELTFDPCYAQNPLVNVLCMGALPIERLVLGIASGPGNLAVLLGSSTGRDGIGGVSVLASAGFGGDEAGAADDTKRPERPGGRPLRGEAADRGLPRAARHRSSSSGIQDLGGAGLACATSETAGRGGVGMDVDVSAVPRREEGMEPWEVMTSESQERMLAIVTPESWPAVSQPSARSGRCARRVVGTVDRAGARRGRAAAHPRRRRRAGARRRAGGVALRRRAALRPAAPGARPPARSAPLEPPAPAECADRPAGAGAFAALGLPPVRPPAVPQHRGRARAPTPRCCAWPVPGCPPSARGVALTTDSNPRACALDPRAGTALVAGRGRGQPGLRRRRRRSPSSTASTSATPSTPR